MNQICPILCNPARGMSNFVQCLLPLCQEIHQCGIVQSGTEFANQYDIDIPTIKPLPKKELRFMKKTHLLYIVCLLLSSLLLLNGFAQDFAAQWHLPEGAKARLGRGKLINIKLSSDSTRVVVSTTVGIWIYDAQTGEVVSLFTKPQTGEKDSPARMVSKGPPEALTFSTDASTIATAHGNSIYVWDTFTGNAFAMLDEHPDSIKALALSPDGTKLATAGGDWTVRLWDVNTGNYIKSLGHPSAVNTVAFSPDGKILASAGVTLRLWDADTGELLHADGKDLGSINMLVFSPDGRTLATGGGWDHTVHLWDVATGALRIGLKGHTGKTRDIAFSPDSSTLITASHDKTMRLWDVNTGTEQKNLPTPDDAITPLVAANRMIKLLERGTLPRKRDDVQTVKFSKDGTQLISVSSDGSLHLWDINTGRYQLSFSLGEHTDWVDVLAFSADSKYLVSNSALEERVRVWSVETFTQHAILTPPQQVSRLTFSPDLKKLAGRDFRQPIRVWDASTKEHLSTLEQANPAIDYWPLQFSPDGKILASKPGLRIFSNTVKLWQTDTGAQLFSLEPHTDAVSEYTFSPDSNIFATGGRDGTIVLWDVETGKSLLNLTGHKKPISALAFSADSKTLASGGGNEIRLWNAHIGDPIGTIDVSENVHALAFSPDEKTLAIGSEEGPIQVWELDPRHKIQTIFTGHQGSIYVLMFSPDGKTLASGSADGTILLWDWETLKKTNDR